MTTSYLKFWGTRGSCPVSGPAFVQYGGNTSCLEVRYKDAHLIIDAGTGIQFLGPELLTMNREIQLFLGHPHWDHLMGFPFFEPIYHANQKIAIGLPAATPKSGKELFNELLSLDFFPIRFDQIKAHIRFCSAEESTPIQIGEITLHFHRTCHPGVTYAFKIKTPHQTIGYASDNEFLKGYHGTLEHLPPNKLAEERSLIEFFSECDLLIHEAQYSLEEYQKKAGWGHSSFLNVIALIREANIKKWLVVHHDPKHSDPMLDHLAKLANQTLAKHKIPCQAEWIGDGHIMSLVE
jgi:phosphoribosyl 1,2-cyclic phosphodiesterase